MPLTPFRIQKFLGGLRYPARKEQVLERARQRQPAGKSHASCAKRCKVRTAGTR